MTDARAGAEVPAVPLLEVRDLAIEFDTPAGRRRVVDQVSFELIQGDVLGILGESGSGKTLTTLAILGLVTGQPGVVGGEIHLRDGDEIVPLLAELPRVLKRRGERPVRKDRRRWDRITHRRMRPLWGRVLTAVFQNPRQSIDPLMTIGAQVEESVRKADKGLKSKDVHDRSLGWLDRVQMDDPERVHRAYAHELSGGMCQRAMIAVAMACKPDLLIADEPTTGLDTTVRAEIVELFKDLLRGRQRSMLYISHDIREVIHLADHVIVMRHGAIVESVSARDLRYGVGERHPYTASLLTAADLTGD